LRCGTALAVSRYCSHFKYNTLFRGTGESGIETCCALVRLTQEGRLEDQAMKTFSAFAAVAATAFILALPAPASAAHKTDGAKAVPANAAAATEFSARKKRYYRYRYARPYYYAPRYYAYPRYYRPYPYYGYYGPPYRYGYWGRPGVSFGFSF
jgi:hypothetical protein